MNKIKQKITIRIMIILIVIIILVPLGITFSKYIHDFIGNYLTKANNFYFSSDKLGSETIDYNVNNWSGSDNFVIQFELNNHKNNLLISDSDIAYNITINCSDDVTCSINNSSGVIYKSEMTDKFTVTITPSRTFDTGELVNVSISATATSPYVKTLSANFEIKVGRKGVSYEISDQLNQPYFNLVITNSRDQYIVGESFDSYEVGDTISSNTYLSLTDINKDKCYSAKITLNFDPNDVIIDTTSNILNNATYTTEVIDGVSYVNSITFDVVATSSTIIRFYKIDVANNYSYPFNSNNSIITFSAL